MYSDGKGVKRFFLLCFFDKTYELGDDYAANLMSGFNY